MIGFLLTLLALPSLATATPAQQVFASCTSVKTTYSAISGLLAPATNPYPAPPVYTDWYTPEDNTYHRHDGSAYLTITDLNIGGTHYTGISCNTFDGFRNIDEGILHHHYNAIWYIGNLGDLSSGFKGNVEYIMTGYLVADPDWMTVHCVLQGFGDFQGYTIMLSYAAPTNGVWTGTCIIR
jgi:hypothetical protein